MTDLQQTRYPIMQGDRRCKRCNEVHDCYPTREGGQSWRSLDDSHDYYPQDWETVARRYGYTPERERAESSRA